MENATQIRKQLGEAEQNEANAELLTGIYYYNNPRLDESLRDGADVNAVGVGWCARKNPTTFSPLALAVKINNQYAVERLLERNANVNGKTEQGASTITEAVTRGNYQIVQKLFRVNPGFATWTVAGDTLLHDSIFSLFPYHVIYCSTWNQNDAQLRQLLIDYYNEKEVTLPESVTGLYKGNLMMVKEAMMQFPSMAVTKASNGFTALELVNNPRKYKQYFYDIYGEFDPKEKNTIQCLTQDGDLNPQILIFKMHLANRSDGKKIPITLIFDFTELRNEIQKMAERSPEYMNERANQLASENEILKLRLLQVQNNLSFVDGKVSAVDTKVGGLATVVKTHSEVVGVDKMADFQRFQKAIESHENAQTFFQYVNVSLGAFHTYCTTVEGGAAPKEGALGLAAKVLGMSAQAIGIIPVVGSFLEKLTKVSSAILDKVDKERETNIAKSVAMLGTVKDMGQIFETVARQLTECYFQPLEEILATATEAKTQYNQFQQIAAKAKKVALKEQTLSPAQQLAACAVMCMIDEVLVSGDKITAKTTNEQLAAILLNAVINRNVASSDDALGKFWEAMLSKLQRDGLRTKTGNIINPVSILAKSGIRTEDRFYMNPNLNYTQFGWRNVKTTDFAGINKNLALYQIGAPTKVPCRLQLTTQNAPFITPVLLPVYDGNNNNFGNGNNGNNGNNLYPQVSTSRTGTASPSSSYLPPPPPYAVAVNLPKAANTPMVYGYSAASSSPSMRPAPKAFRLGSAAVHN